MKVIILNGSPKAKGNTATALREAERILQEQGIETEWIHVGHLQIPGCVACNQTMRQLALNMAFMIKAIQLGLQQYGSPKIKEELTETHFIR